MYTIVRKEYGSNFRTYLGEEDDCYIFYTERQANNCIDLCFNSGKYIDDERWGKVHYYASAFIPTYVNKIY